MKTAKSKVSAASHAASAYRIAGKNGGPGVILIRRSDTAARKAADRSSEIVNIALTREEAEYLAKNLAGGIVDEWGECEAGDDPRRVAANWRTLSPGFVDNRMSLPRMYKQRKQFWESLRAAFDFEADLIDKLYAGKGVAS